MNKPENLSTTKRKPKGGGSLFSNPLVWVLGGVILLAGAFFAVWRGNQSAAKQASPVNVEMSGVPSLKVDQEKVDLGDVPVNQMVTVTFQLANAGDETLRFSKPPYIEVKEGC
jgi:flagellar basal body-associated protein FliL